MIPTTSPAYNESDNRKEKRSTAKYVAIGVLAVGFLGACIGLAVVLLLYKATIFGGSSDACSSKPCAAGEFCVLTTTSYECKIVGVPKMYPVLESGIYVSAAYDAKNWDDATSYCATLHPKAHLMQLAKQDDLILFKTLLFPSDLEANDFMFWTSGRILSGQGRLEFTWTNTGDTAKVADNNIPIQSGTTWDGTGDCVAVQYGPLFTPFNINFYDFDCAPTTDIVFTICQLSATDV